MATAAQITANQKNALASTGPRTDDGKAASSRNAVKHGATSKHVVLAFENPAEFEAMRADLFRTFKPTGALEAFLVEEMAAAQWRIMRMEGVIRHYIDEAAYKHPSRNPMVAMAAVMLSPELQKLQRYENGFRRAFDNAWKRLKELRKARDASEAQNKAKSLASPSVPASSEPAPRPAVHPQPAVQPASPSLCAAASASAPPQSASE